MKRRDFTAGLLIAGTTIQPVMAQEPTKQRRIAIVATGGKPENISEAGSRFWRAFFGELRRLGHFEGGDLIFERYSAEGHPGRYAELAQEVVRLNPDIIFVTGNLLLRAFRPWTGTTPIVANMADPLATGVVQSLARPGGYFTGVSGDAGIEIWGKRLQLLKEAVASITRLAYVGVQLPRMGATRQAVESAAQRLGLSATGFSVEEPSPAEYRRLSAALTEQSPDAVVVTYGFGAGIVQLMEKQRLPAIYPTRGYTDLGGLLAYGSDAAETARQLANDVHQILGGVKPGDIPIYQATKFEFVINLKAANALGLTLPQSLLAFADEVIE
jgi:putative tryptophan/tyrosine transport system substrate-binding protein